MNLAGSQQTLTPSNAMTYKLPNPSPEQSGAPATDRERTGTVNGLDTTLANEILRNIALSGSADKNINVIIGGNINHILNLSSGAARLHTNVIPRFTLILSQPTNLSTLNPFEIRCALCKRVIHYPCWYYEVKYVVNHFHYFVCFDSSSPNKVNCKCYRKG